MIIDDAIIGYTKSGLPIYEPYCIGYAKVQFSNGSLLAGNFKNFKSEDHRHAAELNRQYGQRLMDDFRAEAEDVLGRIFTKPAFNSSKAAQYTTKDCFTEQDFHGLSSNQVDRLIKYIQSSGYEGKIHGAFYMYFYHSSKAVGRF